MKTLALTSSLATIVLSASLGAAQPGPAGDTAAAAPRAAQSPEPGKGPPAMQRMQENMKSMQALMARIHASKDPAERQQLLQQHSKAMNAQMAMMHGLSGGQMGMMGGGMQGGGM